MRQLKITKQLTQRSGESINRYFQEISKYPMISVEEEVELTARIRNDDAVALEKLVVANLRFVVSVAKQFQNQGLSFSDLINEGNIGLVKAAKKFDEKRGFKFISYAVWWIRQSIIQAISDQTRIVRLPINRLTSINKISKAIPYLEQEFEREPTDSEIANYLDLSYEEVNLANEMKMRQISFDMPLSQDNDNDFNLYDFVQTGNIPSPDSNIMKESVTMNINRALSKLTKREASILIMSFGLFSTPYYSLHDIALKFEMTSERVRQIKSKGLIKLKILLDGKYAFLEY
ncbi:MAG: RNA polymerase subunit sigma [Bacteroidetes bacterium GWC2_33_15]|nr:MAG: RNA polymerase subunit sigma [Bacteroidetes bacterium GWA2_33_15]OFX52256.1 MAG: RNA polymerase subunit sigma [Bacteroidetes bacterium GWC2_33_15]OFX64410.1 MAG: RNA polymerase subunit sigma [Bacteroidetes bacterium GWB2_32_14]OFX67815.1 MAG: RNA polymerase subunit sigma [Bacteroidetes bacterium GWD2_33_33]HAN19428.1 RNA polymerase subunit sigma [Bacteroidales bacterium]